MRRKALLGPMLGLVLLLPGCADFGDFVGDTFTYNTNPNRPLGDSENMRRVRGIDTPIGPLSTEPGNVWPTGVENAPTLQELEKEGNGRATAPAPSPDITPYLPNRQPRPAPGSSSPPPSDQPQTTPVPSPGVPPSTLPPPTPPYAPPGGTLDTPRGPQVPATGGSGYQQLAPGNGQPGGIVVPNGNGTSTLIRPDGTVTTIPTPK